MRGSTIARVFGYEALDSRGRPTVAAVVELEGGASGEALAPAGASTGKHEAVELRDGGTRHGGRGVLRAVAHVNGRIATRLRGLNAQDQRGIDAALLEIDGTQALSAMGANAVLAVSLASCRAAAAAAHQPLWRWLATDESPLLPMPMVNILSGGAHAGGIVDVQDYLAVPVGATSFAEAIEWAARVRDAAAGLIGGRGGNAVLVADEGGLAHAFADNTAGFALLTEAIEHAGLEPRRDVAIAVDVAATQLLDAAGEYRLSCEAATLSSTDMASLVTQWVDRFPIISVEDPLGEDDWETWSALTARLDRIQVIGDDLFVTSLQRLRRGIEVRAANAVLAKINQNGTVSGTADVVRQAQAAGFGVIVSARSGETEDSSIADLAVGWRAGQIKVGSLTRSERTAKWNRLLRIEAEAGDAARFAGRAALRDRSQADAL